MDRACIKRTGSIEPEHIDPADDERKGGSREKDAERKRGRSERSKLVQES